GPCRAQRRDVAAPSGDRPAAGSDDRMSVRDEDADHRMLFRRLRSLTRVVSCPASRGWIAACGQVRLAFLGPRELWPGRVLSKMRQVAVMRAGRASRLPHLSVKPCKQP